MKRCVKSSHFPPSEKWALKEAKNKSTALSDGALLCLVAEVGFEPHVLAFFSAKKMLRSIRRL